MKTSTREGHNNSSTSRFSLCDDVFHADVRRPKKISIATGDCRPRPLSFEEESFRRLCGAVIDRRVEELRIMLVGDGLDANARNEKGDTAGHQAAIEGRVDELSILLCHGLDVDAVNKDGNTALHLASRHGTTRVAQRLAEAFPDEEIKNRRGFTALDEAIQAGRTRCTSCIRTFRERGKANAMNSHCSVERLRLEKLRRNKEILYGRDLDVPPQEDDFRGLRTCPIAAGDKTMICASLQATAVALRCVAAGARSALTTILEERRRLKGTRPTFEHTTANSSRISQ